MNTYTRMILALGLWMLASEGFAQELEPKQGREWSPYYLKTQFAGDVGLVSVGVGKQSFSQRLETDLSLGYLPKSVGNDHIFTLALKSMLLPFKPVRVEPVDWHALTTGVQLGYTFGEEYFASEKFLSRYPNSYYRFSTAFHLYLFAGGQVNFTRVEKLNRFKLYYEAGTMAKYLISYVQNPQYLHPGKIFHLAIGAKMHL